MKPITVLSLFNGLSGGMLALNEAGIPVQTYYSSEIDKHAIKETQANFPDIIQLGDVTKWKEWDIDWSSIDLLMGGFPCFPEGTMVMTNKGHKDIKDIQVGDLVLTHTGQYHQVLSTGSKLAPTRIISGMGHLPIECTDNHPFYSRTRYYTRVDGNLTRKFSDPSWVNSIDLTSDSFLTTVKSIERIETSVHDENFWYFIGRFVGDGWTSNTTKHKSYRVNICCGHDEFDELVRCFDRIGYNYNFTKTPTTYKFYIYSKELFTFLRSNVGHGSSQKRIPSSIYNESTENKKSFISGYLDADGYKLKDRDGFSFSSVSPYLIVGFQQLIYETYGRIVTIRVKNEAKISVIDGREVKCKTIYEGFFTLSDKRWTHSYYDEDGNIWFPGVKKNTPTGEWKTVYNIEVAVDNTYTANNIVVHNCQAWSVAGKQGGVNDPRGMLFHTMVDIYQHIKSLNPDLKVLFENVKMKEDFKEYIDNTLQMTPVMINSQHYTAHYRQRYYWYSSDKWFTPPPLIDAPKLQNILESGYTDRDKSYCIDANYFKGGDANQYFNKSRRQMVFFDEDIDRQFLLENGKHKVHYRKLSVVEVCRLQGVPEDYFKVSSDTQAYKMLGNGWTIPVIAHLLRDIFF